MEYGLLEGHIPQIVHNSAIILCQELGLEIICIKPLNDLHTVTVLLDPGTMLLASKLEYSIIILLPILESMVVGNASTSQV